MFGNKSRKHGAWLLGAGLLLAPATLLAAVTPGQSLYVKHCHSCHDDPKLGLGHIQRAAHPAKTSAAINKLTAMSYLKALSSSELGDIAAYVASTPAATVASPVVEYYHAALDHYFISGLPDEIDALDANPAWGWLRTGYGFRSGGSTPVCRFYGSQSPGPNSHFYTASAADCAALRQQQALTPATQKRWNFEDLDFYTTPALAGDCPEGTLPVWRAYNNGQARGIDSNHRYARHPAAIQEVVARGWINEGVMMCAQP